MLSKLGYGLAALVVVALAMACLAWTLLEPPTLPVPPRGVVVIRDVTLVNPGLGRAAHVDITVRGGLITAIGPASAAVSRYDLRCPGCFALPGLIDMNVRMPRRSQIGADRAFGLMFLRHGVTSVRETAAADQGVIVARDAIAGGRWPGPRLISCGWMLDGGPTDSRHPFLVVRDPGGVAIHGATQARAAVANDIAAGARCISLGSRLGPDSAAAAAGAAVQARLPVVATTPRAISLLDAPYISDVLNLTGAAEPTDPHGDDRCKAFAALSDARIADVVAAAARQHTAHTPSLDASRRSGDADCAAADARRARLVKAMFAAGVPVYAGSGASRIGAPPGEALERELRAFAALGLTPDQALVTATTSPGRFWPDATYGQIAIGLPADIVLYRRDPTASLDNLASRQSVVADGRVYASSDLDAWARRYCLHLDRFVNRIVPGAGRLLESTATCAARR